MTTSFNITSPLRISLDKINLNNNITFTSASWVHPVGSSFSQAGFWNDFLAKHQIKDYLHAIELLIDISRCHFSPKIENWPGVVVQMTWTAGVAVPPTEHDGNAEVAAAAAATKSFTLEKGKSAIKPFNRGRGQSWSYTNACLATAGLFHEIFHADANGQAACQLIPGNVNGYTQFCGLLEGWTQAHQTAAEEAFELFITNNGLKQREDKVKATIKAAAAKTIADRLAGTIPPAMGLKNVLRVLTGADAQNNQNPTR